MGRELQRFQYLCLKALCRWLAGGLAIISASGLVGCARSDALWSVVNNLCLPHYQRTGNPAPCDQVSIPRGTEQGFSIIQNPRYPLHFILVPTAALTGIESSRLSMPGRTDYFGYAWLMRYSLAAAWGRPVPDDKLGMAINSAYGRSQNQLHIHLTCLREDVRRQLQAEKPFIYDSWQPLPGTLLRHRYYARRFEQPAAMGIDPIDSVSRYFRLSPPELANYGVALVATTFDGHPGFIALTTRRGWGPGNRASVEALLDKRCDLLTLPESSP